MEKKQYASRKLWILMIALFVVIVAIIFIFKYNFIDKDSTIKDGSKSSSEISITSKESDEDIPENFVKDEVLYTTPYLTLYYPEFWSENIQIEEAKNGDNYELRFWIQVNDKQATLFKLCFGSSNDGYKLGQMRDTNGNTVNVYSIIDPVEEGEEWTSEEVQNINTLQGCVNEILVQVQASTNFASN